MAITRAGWRRLRLQLATALGPRAQGFFLPYRHAGAVRPVPYPALEPLFAAAMPACAAVLKRIDELESRLLAIDGPPPQPRWNQDWFPRLDAAALYAIVEQRRPRGILEVGSGHSTRFMVRAIRDHGIACDVTCIDPAPRADIEGLPLTLRRRVLSHDDLDLAGSLRAGDILFVDSSHLAMPGTDVDLLLNGMLPRLRPGVLVHLHDIFLPDAYPAAWEWRGYNEQLPVACLLHSGGYALRFASHFVATRHAQRLEEGVLGKLPLVAGAHEGSLWLEKLASAYGHPG